MGSLTFRPYIDTTEKQTLITDIADSTAKEFRVEFKRNGTTMWYGFPSSRVFDYPEDSKYFAELQFKDFEYLESIDFPLEDNRQTLITTFALLLNNLGFGSTITTATSWQANNTTTTDDFLNQVFHDTYGLRDYGRNGDETDSEISLFEALERTLEASLFLFQWGGGFNIRQISAFTDPSDVLVSVYNSSGVQQSSTSTDLRETGYTDLNVGSPVIKNTSKNRSYPAIGKASVIFNHRMQTYGISIPSTVELSEAQAELGGITCVTTQNTITGTGIANFNNDVQVGDEIFALNGSFLDSLGVVASIQSNTLLTLEANAVFAVTSAPYYVKQTQNQRFTQSFTSDGSQEIKYSIRGNVSTSGGILASMRWVLRVGTYYYNESSDLWVTSEYINKNNTYGTFAIIGNTPELPNDADGEIELILLLAENQSSNFSNITGTRHENTSLSILEKTAAGESTSIEYSLEQVNEYIESVELVTDFFGDS